MSRCRRVRAKQVPVSVRKAGLPVAPAFLFWRGGLETAAAVAAISGEGQDGRVWTPGFHTCADMDEGDQS